MEMPDWLKPALQGAAAGAAALAIVGFTWGGWVTGGTAEKMASTQADLEVTAALVPVCLELSGKDPKVVATLAELKSASNYKRGAMIMKVGWATMPGTTEPNRSVAEACVDKLAAQF